MKIKSLTLGAALLLGTLAANAQESQAPKLVEIPLNETDTVMLIADTLNQIYGPDAYWRKHQCWVVKENSSSVPQGEEPALFCMKPLAAHVLMGSGGVEKIYIQTTGAQVNPENVMNSDTSLQDTDDFMTGHSQSGAFGAFVLDAQKNQLVSSNYASLYPMEYGSGPNDALTLIPLSDQGDFAWFGEGGFVYQGILTTVPVIYAIQGQEIKDIVGNIPGIQEDKQDYKYSYDTDPAKSANGYYNIQITEQSPDGKTRTFEAQYDPSKGSYWCIDDACMQ